MIPELIFYVVTLLMGILIFFMKFTADGAMTELAMKTLGKVSSVYVIAYSTISIFKLLGILI